MSRIERKAFFNTDWEVLALTLKSRSSSCGERKGESTWLSR
jgi:hypothetical protein